jgi:serine/threonine protein kinase
MTLAAGTKLGPYEILSPLGAGGMGEVYKARDTRLERTVAVKVLPQRLSSSSEVRQRFEREAKTISQLSHAHICALYDVGREGDVEYLVMEYLEGETLVDRLAKGPLSPEQTLRYGVEIADALDKAHRQGIVHRDLKPGNVMLTKSGVKLLDFGLAKAMAPPPSQGSLTALPTQQGLTQEGTILGTFQYMAPEQLEGKDADARTDIFAFGATLYEMATGKKAFSGSTQASLIGAILHTEPAPISQGQPASPPALDRVVKTCLAKDPDERWQSAADIKRELRWIAEGSGSGVSAPATARRGRNLLPWTIAALATLVAAGLAIRSRRPATAATEPMLLSIVPPQRTLLTDSMEISPDGRKLAFVGLAGGKSMLRIRDLDSDDVQTVAGTETAESVFWSPDARFVGFYSRGKLRRVELATGSIEVLCDAELGRGGSWGSKGDILFTPKSLGSIHRVAASGGPPVPAARLEPGDLMQRWPFMLPDGRRFLFWVRTDRVETTGIYLGSLDSPERKFLLRNGAAGQFLPPDTIVFVRGEALLAQRFDLDRGEPLGDPEAVTRPVMRADVAFYRDLFSVSRNGILVFRPGTGDRRLVWVDRRGNIVKAVGPAGVIMNVSLSFDNKSAAFTLRQSETGLQTVWTLDLERDVATPFVEAGWMPIWAADGASIFYRSEGKTYELRRKYLRDQRVETLVSDNFATPYDASPDGRNLIFTRTKSSVDIGVVSTQAGDTPQILLSSEHEERNPAFSPDGRWFVYSSTEPGQYEIFVRRLPMTDEKWAISSGGGLQAMWSRDGKEIFYVGLDGRMMAVPVSTAGGTLTSGAPQPLFQTSARLNNASRQYAVSADGQRFLIVKPTRDFDSELFRVLLNWKPSAGRESR